MTNFQCMYDCTSQQVPLCILSRYTGKERDSESGLDYFGARYFNSNVGRFVSPDWAAKAEPVPYAKLDNPQSLNLYAYVQNNPLSFVDADGHYAMFTMENSWPTSGPEAAVAAQSEAMNLVTNDGAGQLLARKQSQNSTSTTQGESTDFASVSNYPTGAGGFGHTGIQVDSDDTQGFSTADPHVSWYKRLFGAPQGAMEDDLQAHTKHGEVAPHSYIHIPITTAQAQAMRTAMADRTANAGRYNLLFNNCAGFVESVLRAGGVSGVPHGEVFVPDVLDTVLLVERH